MYHFVSINSNFITFKAQPNYNRKNAKPDLLFLFLKEKNAYENKANFMRKLEKFINTIRRYTATRRSAYFPTSPHSQSLNQQHDLVSGVNEFSLEENNSQ